MIKEIDINAPIIPYDSIGGIKLGVHILECLDLIKSFKHKTIIDFDFIVRYEIEDIISLNFNILDGKLVKITALSGYKGSYLKVSIGENIKNLLLIDNSFIYNDFEEYYYNEKGVTIETDPITNNIIWITIYLQNIDNIYI